MKSILIIIVFINITAIAQTDSELDLLAGWMEGSFTSEQQSINDSDYYNISLEMKKIWEDRKDGYWLYVEQAVSEMKEKPYRQRIYHLISEDGKIKSCIYSLPSEKNYIGAWKTPGVFNNLNPDSLEIKEGCDVFIRRLDESTFIGSTNGRNCISTRRGAAYATTEVTITKDCLISWDRGFDNEDVYVWGAEKGGYIFKKIF